MTTEKFAAHDITQGIVCLPGTLDETTPQLDAKMASYIAERQLMEFRREYRELYDVREARMYSELRVTALNKDAKPLPA